MKLRAARPTDSYAIAVLYRLAADGVADYIWSKIDPDNPDLLAVGSQRYAREGVAFSYQNCDVLEHDDQVIGLLMAFPMRVDPDASEEDPVLRPYALLEEDRSLYISGVAILPKHRGRGLGTQLMRHAEQKARELGLAKLSLIVFEDNPARRLYETLGYRETHREAVVEHPLIHHGGYALLMVKAL